VNKLSVIGSCLSSYEYTPHRMMLDKLWPVRLAYDLGYALLNHARWNSDIMHNMRQQVIEAFNYQPQLSVVMIGTIEKKDSDIYQTYKENVAMLRKCGPVICVGIQPSTREWVIGRRAAHNPTIRQICTELDCKYADPDHIDPEICTFDGIHLNEKGHEEIYKLCLSLT
jgi:lysophospholipase L1-like esterase